MNLKSSSHGTESRCVVGNLSGVSWHLEMSFNARSTSDPWSLEMDPPPSTLGEDSFKCAAWKRFLCKLSYTYPYRSVLAL